MDDSGRKNKKSCQDNGKKPRRVKMHFVSPSLIPGFTPGLKLILIFTSRFCFTGDSNSRNGKCETCYRSTGKLIIIVVVFLFRFRSALIKYAHFCSGRRLVRFYLDANSTTQALRGKDREVILENFSLFIVCLLLVNFTPWSEFNWQTSLLSSSLYKVKYESNLFAEANSLTLHIVKP